MWKISLREVYMYKNREFRGCVEGEVAGEKISSILDWLNYK